MTLSYLEDRYDFSNGEICFPGENRERLWVSIHWEKLDRSRRFSFTIEDFPGNTEAEILGEHSFGCANDCDQEWDGKFAIGVYDGIHANLYNGKIIIERIGSLVRISGFGYIADSMHDFNKHGGCRVDFDEMVHEKVC